MSTKIKKIIDSQIDFNSFLREKTIIASSLDQYDIFDVNFFLYTLPASQPLLPSQGLICPEDVRLYINGESYTRELIQELKSLLANEDQTKVKRQYQTGVSTWLNYLAKFNFGEYDIPAERTALATLLNTPLGAQLDRLGNRKTGAFGNLHILNFLYKDISLEAVSINNLIKRKYPAGGRIKSVKDLIPLKLTFSSGPAPSFEDFDTRFQPRGILKYVIDFIYDNPLYELMQQINQQSIQIQKQLEDQRTNYLEPTINELQIVENDAKLKLAAIEKLVKEVEDSIKPIREAAAPTN